MDLFQKLGLSVLSWEDDVKLYHEEENEKKQIRECLLKDNDSVYLVELKPIAEVTPENTYRIYYFLTNYSQNFLRLKHLIKKDDKTYFFAYEKATSPMVEYMAANELPIEKRLYIYKNAIETVCTLIYYKEDFTEFDQTLFFIHEKENAPTGEKFPSLRIIYHAGLAKSNKEKTFSNNYFYWLFYLYFLVFKDYSKLPNMSNTYCDVYYPAGIFSEDLKILSELLYEIVSSSAATSLTIEALVNFYNKILLKAKIEEIVVMNLNNTNSTMSTVNNANSMNTVNSVNINYNNSNGKGVSSMTNPQNNFNPIHTNFNQNYMKSGNYLPHLGVPMTNNPHMINVNNNFNNSQINYNQYFQFYNSNPYFQNSNFGFLNERNPSGLGVNMVPNLQNMDTNTLMQMYMNLSTYPSSSFNFLENPMPTSHSQPTNLNHANSMFNMNMFNSSQNSKSANPYQFNSHPKKTPNSNQNSMPMNFPTLNYNINNSNNFYMKDKKNKLSEDSFSIDNIFNDKYSKYDIAMGSLANPNLRNAKTNSNCNSTSDAFNTYKTSDVKLGKIGKNSKSTLPNKSSSKTVSKNCADIIFQQDPVTLSPCINILIDKKTITPLMDKAGNLLSKINSTSNPDSESGSVYSENDKEFLKRKLKRNSDANDSLYNDKCLSSNNDNSSTKKKLRAGANFVIKPKEAVKEMKESEGHLKNDISSKVTLSYNNFDEKELEMINKIDNPRRKKLKNLEEKSNKFFIPEKTSQLKLDLTKFLPQYNEELEKVLMDQSHKFMKVNFPLMYNLENFYLYIKLNQERKSNKIGSMLAEEIATGRVKDIPFEENGTQNCENLNNNQDMNNHQNLNVHYDIQRDIQSDSPIEEAKEKINSDVENLENLEKIITEKENNCIEEEKVKNNEMTVPITPQPDCNLINVNTDSSSDVCKKVWDCNKMSSKEVDDYLYKIEKLWPNDKFVWCQETALCFLSQNDYNVSEAVQHIQDKSEEFKSYLTEKRISIEDNRKNLEMYHMHSESGKCSKRLQYKRYQV